MIHHGTGITVAGCGWVDVKAPCSDIVNLYVWEGGVDYVLSQVPMSSYGAMVPSTGRPMTYALADTRIHLWPTPDRAYALRMSWNTNATWNQGWMAAYSAALKQALAERELER